MAVEPAKVKLDLAGIGGFELAELEFDHYQTLERAVKEKQVHEVILAVERDPLLAGYKREARAKFEEEALHLAEDGGFEVLLGIDVGEPEEIEDAGVAENEIGRELVFGPERVEFLASQCTGVFRAGGALVKHSVDFVSQCTGAPSFDPAHLGIKVALERIIQVDEGLEVRPAQFSPQRGDNLGIGERFREANHVAQRFLTEASSKLRLQLSLQCGDNFLPIPRTLFLQHFPPDPIADIPVEHGQAGVGGPGNGIPRCFNEVPHL